jgi:hypothetical protein
MARRRALIPDFVPAVTRLPDHVPPTTPPSEPPSSHAPPLGDERRQSGAAPTSPELREAFRLAVARMPASDWPEAARDAYNAYVRERRERIRRGAVSPSPSRPPALSEAFRMIARHVPVADWSDEAREAYNGYQRDRRRLRAEQLQAGRRRTPH